MQAMRQHGFNNWEVQMSKHVALVFCNPVRYGGHVTFTAHLIRGMRAAGADVNLYCPHTRTETFRREFGYGMRYQNMTIEDLFERADRVLVVAPSKPKAPEITAILKAGGRMVVHDPAEFKHGWSHKLMNKRGPIVIRKSMLEHLPDARFILHPYKRKFDNDHVPTGEVAGISISRIDFDKHTELLLDANRLIKKKRDKIKIHGFENRIYTRFKILPNYPEWTQSIAAYPRTFRAAVDLCATAAFMFDMSVIKQDGGGTQYTFLEAMDAGSVCVLNQEWILEGHTMKPGVNCLAVTKAKQIAKLIKVWRDGGYDQSVIDIRANARKLLKKHNAEQIGALYREELKA